MSVYLRLYDIRVKIVMFLLTWQIFGCIMYSFILFVCPCINFVTMAGTITLLVYKSFRKPDSPRVRKASSTNRACLNIKFGLVSHWFDVFFFWRQLLRPALPRLTELSSLNHRTLSNAIEWRLNWLLTHWSDRIFQR